MLACEATTLERMMRPCSMTAAPVSSQELSIARMRIGATFLLPMSRGLRTGLRRLRGAAGGVGTLILFLGCQSRRQRLCQMKIALAIVIRHNVFGPHDERVFSVIAVVASTDALLAEPVLV